jgi:methionine biosynthesis protein MetW
MTFADLLRADLRLITEMVPEGSRVLDLGCGDGSLMAHLRDEKGCTVRGVDLSPEDIASALSRGLSVVQTDLDEGLSGYGDSSFDFVVLSQTLQVVRRPAFVLREMLRVGQRGHRDVSELRALAGPRLPGGRGRMPVSRSIPFSWYDTPNIHHTTITDFRDFVAENGGAIEQEVSLVTREWAGQIRRVRVWPNLFADTAVALVKRA